MTLHLFITPCVFFFSAIIAFYIPGDLLVSRLHIEPLQRVLTAISLGIVLWALQGFVFGFLGVRFLTYIYLIFFLTAWINLNKQKKIYLKNVKIDKTLLSIIIVGSLSQLSAVWFIGYKTAKGLLFCCRGIPDAIYHLALTNSLIQSIPPQEPGMSGAIVSNYHYLSNLVVADLVRVFRLPLFETQFQYANITLVFLLGLSIIVISKMLKLKAPFARFLALFVFFNSSALYVLTFLRGRGFNFDIEILDDATKLLAGPPRAFSIVLLFSSLPLFLIWIKTKKIYPGILLSLILGSLIGFKVYTGIFAVAGLVFLLFYFIIKKRPQMVIPIITAFIVMALFYLPVNKLGGSFHFNGFWRIENFILTKDLAIARLEYIRLNFLNHKNYLAVAVLEAIFLFSYIIFQFGSTALAFLQNKKSLSILPKELNIFLISGLLFSLIAGLFFIQNPGGANSIQFVITFFIISSIYAALACHYWLQKIPKVYAIVASLIITVLTISFSVHEVVYNIFYIKNSGGFFVNNDEINSLQHINNISDHNSLFLIDPAKLDDETILYLTLLTKKKLYLAATGLLHDHGVNTIDRENFVRNIFNVSDQEFINSALKNNDIRFIYLSNSDIKGLEKYKIEYSSQDKKILDVN